MGSALPYMPLFIAEFDDATKSWPSDARLLYLELLKAQWTEGGILPANPKELQRIARVTDWPTERFASAWAVIQGGDSEWKAPKFLADQWGVFNPKNREVYKERFAVMVTSYKGTLKAHGCPSCRSRGIRTKIGNPEIRRCPICGHDLWSSFREPLWLSGVIPRAEAKEAKVHGSELDRRMAIRHSREVDYAAAVEDAFLKAIGVARVLMRSEMEAILEWERRPIPLEEVLKALSANAGRIRSSKSKSLRYLIPILEERMEEIERLSAPGMRETTPKVVAHVVPVESKEWNVARERLRSEIPAKDFKALVSPLVSAGVVDGKLVLVCPNALLAGAVRSTRGREIAEALGMPCTFVTEDDALELQRSLTQGGAR